MKKGIKILTVMFLLISIIFNQNVIRGNDDLIPDADIVPVNQEIEKTQESSSTNNQEVVQTTEEPEEVVVQEQPQMKANETEVVVPKSTTSYFRYGISYDGITYTDERCTIDSMGQFNSLRLDLDYKNHPYIFFKVYEAYSNVFGVEATLDLARMNVSFVNRLGVFDVQTSNGVAKLPTALLNHASGEYDYLSIPISDKTTNAAKFRISYDPSCESTVSQPKLASKTYKDASGNSITFNESGVPLFSGYPSSNQPYTISYTVNTSGNHSITELCLTTYSSSMYFTYDEAKDSLTYVSTTSDINKLPSYLKVGSTFNASTKVAFVDNVGYDSIQEAYAQAKEGDVILVKGELSGSLLVDKLIEIKAIGETIWTLHAKESIEIQSSGTFKDITFQANTEPGYAPIFLSNDNARLIMNGCTINNSGSSKGDGVATSKQGIAITKKQGVASLAPQAVYIDLTNTTIQLNSASARGICFFDASKGSTIVLKNSKILNGNNPTNQWLGGYSRGISLANAYETTVNVLNDSQVAGFQYAINSAGSSIENTKSFTITVDHSTLIGWTGFNIWTSNGKINVQNNAEVIGLNGSFNLDKEYSFASIVINDDIYDNGWGTAMHNEVTIDNSTIKAITKDGQPTQELIRIDNAMNTKLSIKGNSRLVKETNGSSNDWTSALYSEYINSKADLDRFVKEHMVIDSAVTLEGLANYAYNQHSNSPYVLVKVKADSTHGSATTPQASNLLVPCDSTIQVQAKGNTGYVVEGWYVNGKKIAGDTATSIRIPADYKSSIFTVEAKFKAVPTEILLSKTNLEMRVGTTATLTATVLPNEVLDKTVTWSSSNAQIVQVENGVLTAVKSGTATITARIGNLSKSCVVIVKNKNIIHGDDIVVGDNTSGITMSDKDKEQNQNSISDTLKDIVNENDVVTSGNSSVVVDAIKQAIQNNLPVSINMGIKTVQDTDVNVKTLSAIKNVTEQLRKLVDAKSASIAQYLDLNMNVVVDNTSVGSLEVLAKPIAFSIDIPKDLQKAQRDFYIIRIHGNDITRLATVDNGDGTISFETDRFSTYALVYVDDAKKVLQENDTITIEEAVLLPSSNDETNSNSDSGNVNTGDTTSLPYYFIALVVSFGALFFMRLKLKKS